MADAGCQKPCIKTSTLCTTTQREGLTDSSITVVVDVVCRADSYKHIDENIDIANVGFPLGQSIFIKIYRIFTHTKHFSSVVLFPTVVFT